jgi:hypothetical protein
MKKITTLLLGLMVATFAFGKSVTIEQANQVANKYLSATSMKAARSVANSFSKSYNGITTYYVFNYTGGGFVVVSADDAARPILAQSDEGFIETEITNPEARYWFENYSKEIAHIVAAKADNAKSRADWDNILNNKIKSPSADVVVGPLLTTTWDQEGLYNYYCPVDAAGTNGKVPTGCVATTMGQLMKYHNFPATGVGKHSYSHGTYGLLSANYDTVFNFSAMSNTATNASYKSISKLLHHAGVSVDMNYAPDGSGAQSESVPFALTNYFNYDNTTIAFENMSDYTPIEWNALLISELNATRPLYYSGDDGTTGHAWVCDGYQTTGSVTMFHMNWGWSGSSNGYYAIGSLNTPGYAPNQNNSVIIGIKPGNPDLIVRFTDLEQNNSAQKGSVFNINCKVVKGTPTDVKLFIDNEVVFSTAQTTISYPWNTADASFGVHTARVEATDGTNTVYWEVNIGLSEWSPEASGFATPSRGIKYMQAVNQDVVWATAYDGRSGSTYVQEYTKTTNGGNTWTTGTISNCAGLEPGMIFALSKDTAYVPMFKQTGTKPQGIYVTRNGGTTWTRQTTAAFGASSFPNVVHFFNKNDGFCMGDPINGEFEVYNTSNGGTTWTLVSGANIPNPISGEYGIIGFYSAVGDNAWFGTNKGRVYRSVDKGLHWDASTASTGASETDVAFRDALNGLAVDKSTGIFSETSDGGATWNDIFSTGSYSIGDFAYVPGTANTWVTVGYGAYYSFDGGHSWATFPGTQAGRFLAVDFANNQCGWAGTFNASATSEGMFKYSGVLEVLNSVSNLTATPGTNSVQLSWTEPATTPLSYNIYCNDILLTNTSSLQYTDLPLVGGTLNYCVAAVYALGESEKTCATAEVVLGLANTEQAAYRIYPNPSSDIINVVAPAKFNEVRLVNSLGKVVYKNNTKGSNLCILTAGIQPGVYVLQIYTGTQVISKKVSITR